MLQQTSLSKTTKTNPSVGRRESPRHVRCLSVDLSFQRSVSIRTLHGAMAHGKRRYSLTTADANVIDVGLTAPSAGRCQHRTFHHGLLLLFPLCHFSHLDLTRDPFRDAISLIFSALTQRFNFQHFNQLYRYLEKFHSHIIRWAKKLHHFVICHLTSLLRVCNTDIIKDCCTYFFCFKLPSELIPGSYKLQRYS